MSRAPSMNEVFGWARQAIGEGAAPADVFCRAADWARHAQKRAIYNNYSRWKRIEDSCDTLTEWYEFQGIR